ncbi:HET-domain-containing protein [Fusarium austroafricanum]|uniref:HET-domain-containing protein n=1 Tax=Fusarium austroafricanum TaxID=2364996 RepID=A0A8H4NFM4_9HYPO|nr:HET-domain-containing protein [Fusarium austroafricanum]
MFRDSNWRGDRDEEPLKYQAVIHIEPNIQRRVFSIRWRETPLHPSPSVQDSEPYYFVAPNLSIAPKRLLDLKQVQNLKVIKLLELSTILDRHIRYATLSHCWGPKASEPPLRTTTINIKQHLEGISMDGLTLNYRHAVLDSKTDWELEAAKMADTYHGGYLNIVAVAASDAHGDFIRDDLGQNQQDRFTDIH